MVGLLIIKQQRFRGLLVAETHSYLCLLEAAKVCFAGTSLEKLQQAGIPVVEVFARE